MLPYIHVETDLPTGPLSSNFGSQSVKKDSNTPYSDATQVCTIIAVINSHLKLAMSL